MNCVLALAFATGLMGQVAAAAGNETATVITLVGAGGTPEYSDLFASWSARWRKAALEGGNQCFEIGPRAAQNDAADSGDTDLERLTALVGQRSAETSAPLWLVLIGHGTYDGRAAKFNLRGPDLSADALAELLASQKRPVIVVGCFSSSGPFLIKLSAAGRVVVTSTRSGHEHNFSRFGEYLSAAIADPEADLDHDGQTSLLEAYLLASRRTADFYESDGRLATEHPLLDDTGDQRGTPADWFRGTHVVKQASGDVQPDGRMAHRYHLLPAAEDRNASPDLLAQRQRLETAIAELRDRKSMLDPDEYYRRLEVLLVELARLSSSTP